MHIKLRQLAHARALYRHGSFRRAAEAEHISQPALSRSIQSLEESLGVLLFDRNTTEIAPTVFGMALLRRAEGILADAEELEREMVLLQGLDVGSLSVGMGLYAAELSGNLALAHLFSEHPGLDIRIQLRYWGELERLVHERQVDLGFGEVAHLIDEQALMVEPVAHHELVFFCRPGHPVLARPSISAADLDAYTLVSSPVRASDARLFPRNLRVDESGDYSIPHVQADDLMAIRTMVAHTNAFSFATPIQLEHLLKVGEVVPIPFRAPWLRLDYGFFYLAARSLSPAAGSFMAKVREIERDLAEKNRRLIEEIFNDLSPERRLPVQD